MNSVSGVNSSSYSPKIRSLTWSGMPPKSSSRAHLPTIPSSGSHTMSALSSPNCPSFPNVTTKLVPEVDSESASRCAAFCSSPGGVTQLSSLSAATTTVVTTNRPITASEAYARLVVSDAAASGIVVVTAAIARPANRNLGRGPSYLEDIREVPATPLQVQ